MTTTEPTTHEPAPVVLIPEVSISPDVLAKIERARQVLALSGLADLARDIYESVTPVLDTMLEGATDEVFGAVSKQTGWGELYALVTDLAGALLVSVGGGYADLTLPEWMTDEDAARRDAAGIVDLAMLRPELFGAMMADLANDPALACELAKRAELRQRDQLLAAEVRRAMEVEGLTHLMETTTE